MLPEFTEAFGCQIGDEQYADQVGSVDNILDIKFFRVQPATYSESKPAWTEELIRVRKLCVNCEKKINKSISGGNRHDYDNEEPLNVD